MFQLVLQFDGQSPEALNAIVQIEEQLISLLGDSASVDGHDVGSEEVNVFIHTSEPMHSFKMCHAFLQNVGPGVGNYRAAYRSLAGSQYTALYPAGLAKFRVE